MGDFIIVCSQLLGDYPGSISGPRLEFLWIIMITICLINCLCSLIGWRPCLCMA